LALILIPTFVSIVGIGSKPSPKVGFHEMDEVCSFHHFLELVACFLLCIWQLQGKCPFCLYPILETSE
jgi:hypothetical protein